MATAPVGILGGTFDPIHLGHLRLARGAGADAAARRGAFRAERHPAAPRRSRARRPRTGSRWCGWPWREIRCFTWTNARCAAAGPAYTFDTLTELRAEIGAATPLVLLVGADAFLDFAAWHRWHELFGLAHIAVAHRPGFPVERWRDAMPQPLAREYAARLMQQPLAVHLAAGRRHRGDTVHGARHFGHRDPRARAAPAAVRVICSPIRFSIIFSGEGLYAGG